MSVNQIIAQGFNPGEGLVRAYTLAEELQNRRQQNELYATAQQQRMQMAQQQQTQEQQALQKQEADAAELEDIGRTYELMKSGDPIAVEHAFSNAPPEFVALRKRDPMRAQQALMGVMERTLGVSQKQGAPPASVQEYEYAQANPGFQQYQDRNRAPAGSSAPDAPADQRLYEWFASQTPEAQAAFLNMKRSSATPEAAAALATAKTTAAEQAKAGVAAQGDLSRVESNATEMRRALRTLKTSKGMSYIFGAASLAPIVPGTAQADAFAVWEQVQGKAFLEAFNSLKGGGQITEKEGEKATAAITRLSNRRQSVESALAAIKELEEVVTAAENRARAKAARGAPQRPGQGSASESGVMDWEKL